MNRRSSSASAVHATTPLLGSAPCSHRVRAAAGTPGAHKTAKSSSSLANFGIPLLKWPKRGNACESQCDYGQVPSLEL